MSLRTKSAVWEYFLRCPNGEDKMVCRMCNGILSGRNASNAKKHLRYSHRSEYEDVENEDRVNLKRRGGIVTEKTDILFNTTNDDTADSDATKFNSVEKDMCMWLSKPTVSLCSLLSDDCKRFIQNYDKKFDLPKRKNFVVSTFIQCAHHVQRLIESHIKNAVSRLAITVSICQAEVILLGVGAHFIDSQFQLRRVFLGSALMKTGSTLQDIRSRVYRILEKYSIDGSQVSAFITNGPPIFMAAYKKYLNDLLSILDEDDFVRTCSSFGNFTEDNDDFCVQAEAVETEDVFSGFPAAEAEMSGIFSRKHIMSFDLQLEYVLSRVSSDTGVVEILSLVEKFRRDADFTSKLAAISSRPIMVSWKSNWKCQYFAAKRIISIHDAINKVAHEKQLPLISEKAVATLTNYVDLIEPFVTILCSAQPDRMLSEVYGSIQSLVFHCGRLMERGGTVEKMAETLRNELRRTFAFVLTDAESGITQIGAALFNPNQSFLVDIDRRKLKHCIAELWEKYWRPIRIKQEQPESPGRVDADSFEEFMIKKRRVEEQSKRGGMNSEQSPQVLADLYLNLVSTRPANCNPLEYWQSVPVDLDPLTPVALDYLCIPASVSIYEFCNSLGISAQPSNASVQFFSVRNLIHMNRDLLIENTK